MCHNFFKNETPERALNASDYLKKVLLTSTKLKVNVDFKGSSYEVISPLMGAISNSLLSPLLISANPEYK